MKIALVSAFRNSASYLPRYFNQMDELQKLLNSNGYELSLVLGYGDSLDQTDVLLYEECNYRFNSLLIDVSHGGPHFGSIVHPQRFKQLAYVGNKLWSNLPKDADFVGLVESDLIWKPESLYRLVEGLELFSMVAPMVLHLDKRFYDTWAFQMAGERFKAEKPYHPLLTKEKRYYSMDSVGSVFVMEGDVARATGWPEKDVVVGLCRHVRAMDYQIFLDRTAEVFHP